MFAESIHSLADTINQLILAYGIHKSVQVQLKLNLGIKMFFNYFSLF